MRVAVSWEWMSLTMTPRPCATASSGNHGTSAAVWMNFLRVSMAAPLRYLLPASQHDQARAAGADENSQVHPAPCPVACPEPVRQFVGEQEQPAVLRLAQQVQTLDR